MLRRHLCKVSAAQSNGRSGLAILRSSAHRTAVAASLCPTAYQTRQFSFALPPGIPTLVERGATGFFGFLTSTSTEVAATAATASSSGVLLGLEPALLLTLVLTGAVFRLATLGISVYSDVCVARLAALVPSLQLAFLRYQDIASHEASLQIEIELAFNQLKERRHDLFRKNKTSNARIVVLPALVAAVTAAACLTTFPAVASGLNEACTAAVADAPGVDGSGLSSIMKVAVPHVLLSAAAFAATGGGTDAVSLLHLSFSPATAENCIANLLSLNSMALYAAVAIGTRNVSDFFAWRSGFSEKKDLRQQQLSKGVQAVQFGTVLGGYVVGTAVYGVLVATTASSSSVVATSAVVSYMGPILFGITLVSRLQTVARGSAWTSVVFAVPSVPRSHGMYRGDGFTGGEHIKRMNRAFEAHELHVSQDQYEKVKEFLEGECDRLIAINKRVARQKYDEWTEWVLVKLRLRQHREERDDPARIILGRDKKRDYRNYKTPR